MSYKNPRLNKRKHSVRQTQTQNESASALMLRSDSGAFVGTLLALFSKVDSILASQEVNCIPHKDLSAPAMTDGTSIYFKADLLEALSKQTDLQKAIIQYASLRGLNLHELAHIKYSPRSGTKLMSSIKSVHDTHEQVRRNNCAKKGEQAYPNPMFSVLRVFNILEDQRIETIMTRQYSNSIAYLQQTILEFILNIMKDGSQAHLSNENGAVFAKAHLLIHGRRYLPLRIRKEVKRLAYEWIDSNNTSWSFAPVEKLIDEFRQLSLPNPKNNERAVQIIVEVSNLLDDSPLSNHLYNHDKTTPDNHENGWTKGTNNTQREQNEALEKPEASDDNESQEEEGDTLPDNRHDDSQDDSGSGSSDDSSDSDGDSDSDTDSGGSDSKKSTKSDSSDSSSTPGRNGSSHDAETEWEQQRQEWKQQRQDVADKLNKLTQQINEARQDVDTMTRNEIVKTLANVRQKVDTAGIETLFRQTEDPVYEKPASSAPVFVALSNRLSTALQQLKADTDNQWELGTNSGSLDVARWIAAQGRHFDVFNKWLEEGEERPDAEVVILLDQSGSMSTRCNVTLPNGTVAEGGWDDSLLSEASNMAWAIKKACQSNDIPCTVIGYSGYSETAVLYQANSMANVASIPVFATKSSTVPEVALKMAYTIFKKSEAVNKLLFSLSDGEWHVTQSTIQTVNGINELAKTFFVALSSDGHYYSSRVTEGGQAGWSDSSPTPYSKGYNHHHLLLVNNLVSLTKTIGKEIVKACHNSNH